jgi:hypothetical protein
MFVYQLLQMDRTSWVFNLRMFISIGAFAQYLCASVGGGALFNCFPLAEVRTALIVSVLCN